MKKERPSQRRRTRKSTKIAPDLQPGQLAANLGEPIRLTEVNLHGVAARAAREGENAEIWTRLAMTSDAQMFHRIADNLSAVIEHSARQDGKAISLKRAATILLVMRADNSAELWLDAAAVSINVLLKRDANAGSVIFESDIADVTGMDFPMVEIEGPDRVLCIFRQDWRFALYFDFNPDEAFDRTRMIGTLGMLHRTLRYRHLYDVVADQALFERLVAHGWFPFVEIIASEFKELASACEAEFELTDVESKLLENFDQIRLEQMFSRWMAKPHFAAKREILRAALNSYLAHEPIAAIKIVLTEIEGILGEAYRAANGKGARIKALLAFAVRSAEEKSGAPDTLLFPASFARYLEAYTFAPFDPAGTPAQAGSRHAVGHGAAEAESYTLTRALQALLTLDQISFYT